MTLRVWFPDYDTESLVPWLWHWESGSLTMTLRVQGSDLVPWLWHWESGSLTMTLRVWFPDYRHWESRLVIWFPDYDTERPGEWAGSQTMTLRDQESELVPYDTESPGVIWFPDYRHWESRLVIWFPDYRHWESRVVIWFHDYEWSGSQTMTLRDQGSDLAPWLSLSCDWHWEARGVIWWQKIASISSTVAGNIPVIASQNTVWFHSIPAESGDIHE